MKRHTLLILSCLLMGMQMAVAQEHVTNIRAKQEEKIVTIRYDLSVRSEVKLFVSLDDGQHYTDTMKMTGMLNKIVPAGKNKTIHWQAFKDLGYGDYPEIRFKFVTEEKQQAVRPKQIPKRTFVTLNVGCTNMAILLADTRLNRFKGTMGVLTPTIGITGGQVKKFGWFASIMTNFNFIGFSPDATSNENWQVGIEDDMGNYYNVLPFYCEEGAYSELSIIGGGIMRLTDMMYLKAGLGYGHRSVSLKTYDGRWVRNRAFSANNVDVDLGMMFNFNHFVLSLDGVISMDGLSSWFSSKPKPVKAVGATSATSFKKTPTLEARIGFGYSF